MSAQEEAAKLLEDLRLMLERGGQFVMEQAPPLAREIVLFGRVFETFLVVSSLLVLVIAVVWARARFGAWTVWSGEHDSPHIGFFLTIIPSVVSALVFLLSVEGAIIAWFAPRLYVINHIAEMLK